jgi:hypothetical protein
MTERQIIVVSFSELLTAKRCSFKHQAAYVERWSKRAAPDSALGKGSAWHSVLEAHYNEIMKCQREGEISRTKILDRCKAAVMPIIYDLATEEIQDLIWWMYEGYVNYYGSDEDWQIIAVEHGAECALPDVGGDSDPLFRLKVKIDLVVKERSTGRIRIVDHKSGKDLPHKKTLEIDDQFPLYQWALTRLGKRVFGLTYSAARTLRLQADIKEPGTTPLDERYARVSMHRTDKEMEGIAHEAADTALTRYLEQARVKAARRDPPRTTDPLRCQWDCDFRDACLAGRKGMDWRDMLHHTGYEQQFERH